MGLFDPITDSLFGGTPQASPSGAFPGLGELGGEFQKFLMDRLKDPAGSSQFKLGSQVIRDALSTSGATARQRLGDAATTGGFLDSGVTASGLLDIERGQSQAFASSLSELLLGLEDRRDQGVLQFLSQGAGENTSIQGMNLQSQSARDSLQFGLIDKFAPSASGEGGFFGR